MTTYETIFDELRVVAQMAVAAKAATDVETETDDLVGRYNRGARFVASARVSYAICIKQYNVNFGKKFDFIRDEPEGKQMNGNMVWLIVRDGVPCTILLRRRNQKRDKRAFRVDVVKERI